MPYVLKCEFNDCNTLVSNDVEIKLDTTDTDDVDLFFLYS